MGLKVAGCGLLVVGCDQIGEYKKELLLLPASRANKLVISHKAESASTRKGRGRFAKLRILLGEYKKRHKMTMIFQRCRGTGIFSLCVCHKLRDGHVKILM